MRKATMDKNTTTSSSNGHNLETVPTCMTAAELASYQAQWEQIDYITAQKLKEAKGIPSSHQRALGLDLTSAAFQNKKRKSRLRDSAYGDMGVAVPCRWGLHYLGVSCIFCCFSLLSCLLHPASYHFAFCSGEVWLKLIHDPPLSRNCA